MIKESKANVKKLVTSCYTVEDTEKHITFVGLINTVNEQDIQVYLKKIKQLLKSKKEVSELLIGI